MTVDLRLSSAAVIICGVFSGAWIRLINFFNDLLGAHQPILAAVPVDRLARKAVSPLLEIRAHKEVNFFVQIRLTLVSLSQIGNLLLQINKMHPSFLVSDSLALSLTHERAALGQLQCLHLADSLLLLDALEAVDRDLMVRLQVVHVHRQHRLIRRVFHQPIHAVRVSLINNRSKLVQQPIVDVLKLLIREADQVVLPVP